jgi:hypothetical protein
MTKTTNQVTLTGSEIEYVYACWKQAYSTAYKNFEDYLKIAISGKEITGSVYN